VTRRKQPDPPAFDYDHGMRHTCTTRLMPYMHDMLDRLCRDLMRAQNEGGLDAEDEQPTVRDLRAAAADLRFIADWLMHAGDQDAETRWENRLLDLGERLAGRVTGIAEELEAALAAAPAE
jgi:hypothetical protein